MAFDKSKDVTIKEWELDNGDGKKLMVSVVSYNNGEPKLQIGPRIYQKKSGGPGYGKAGRLNTKEVNFLAGVIKDLNTNTLIEG